MPPTLALLLWLILLLGLLVFDPAKEPAVSPSLWLPVIWMFIIGSRLPAQWLSGQVGGVAGQAFEDGNPLDRNIFFGLILLSLIILISRSFRWGEFFARNLALVAFLAFAFVSVMWSDFPFVAFKRWFRDLGNYLVILVVLSDPRPLEAVRTVLRRLSYLLIPLSILLIKYYPQGKTYDPWTGVASFVGATTSKNMLGVVCLVSSLFFFWDTIVRWADRREPRTKRIILVNVAFIAMGLWLLNLANSATSRVCLVIGCLVILAVRSKWGRHHPTLIQVLVPASFLIYLVLAFGFDLNGNLASEVGRDPTLTDRTLIWHLLLSLHTNPLVGTGYDSFWLGSRLQYMWQHTGQHLNESHNGYLEVYLDLGLIGLALLIGFLISCYSNICKRLEARSSLSDFRSFNLALWTVVLFYNMTEAAFRGSLIWVVFLLGAVVFSMQAARKAYTALPVETVDATVPFTRLPLGTASLRK